MSGNSQIGSFSDLSEDEKGSENSDPVFLEETEEEAMMIWEDESRDQIYWDSLDTVECNRRVKLLTAHLDNRTKFQEIAAAPAALNRKRKLMERLEEAKLKQAKFSRVTAAGISENDEMEYTRALLEVMDEDGIVRNVESKDKIGEKMLSSAIFRRLATEEVKSRVLSGQSLQLKSEQLKAELERKREEGLMLVVLYGSEIRATESQTHNLRLPQLMSLPVVTVEAKWSIFTGIKPWQGSDFGLRDFVSNKSCWTFESLSVSLDNAGWLAVGVFGESVSGIFSGLKELARLPQVMNVLQVEFVEWVFVSRWKELWGILRATYRRNDELVVLQNGGWIPLWDTMIGGIVLSELAQNRWLIHVRKDQVHTNNKESVAKAPLIIPQSRVNEVRPSLATHHTRSDQLCLVELAHGVKCIIGGKLQGPCPNRECRYDHNWKGAGKAKSTEAVTNGKAFWLTKADNRAALSSAIQRASF